MLAIFSKRLQVDLTEGATFYFRPLSAGELMTLNLWAQDIRSLMAKPPEQRADAGKELASQLFAELQLRLVDWKIDTPPGATAEYPFSTAPGALSHLLTLTEAMQLLGKMIAANTIGADDKGKSQPPSASNSASDAAPAAAANA